MGCAVVIKPSDGIEIITTHYIERALNPTAEVMDIIRPTDGQVIARVTLADEEDTRRAIAAAKHATYGRSTREEHTEILPQLHEGRFATTQ